MCAAALLVGALASSAGAQSTARFNQSTTLLPNGDVLIVGGQSDLGVLVPAGSSVEIFRANSGRIDTSGDGVAQMGVARASHTATVLPNGNVLIVGGADAAGDPIASFDIYDPAANTWAGATASALAQRMNHTATLLKDGRVLITGGQSGNTVGTIRNDCALFTAPATIAACPAALQATLGRAGHSATLLFNGFVYVAGGQSSNGTILSTSELFDPVLNVWTPGPALIQKRAFHTATALGNRNVMIIGGASGRNERENQGILDTAEIYNPGSNTMMPPPATMNSRKMFHTASLDPDGTLAIHGGIGNLTTSFLVLNATFDINNYIDVIGSAPGAGSPPPAQEGVLTNSSLLTTTLAGQLSETVTGRVVSGTVYYSSASASVNDADIYFVNNARFPPDQPESQFSTLDGMTVNKGTYRQSVQILRPTGTVFFKPQNVSSSPDSSINGGSLVFAGGCPGGGTCTLDTASELTIDVDFTIAASNFLPGFANRLVAGRAFILSGSLSRDNSDTVIGYTVSLTSGVSDGVGANSLQGTAGSFGTIYKDILGNVHYQKSAVRFSLLEGTINNTTTFAAGNLTTPQDPSGLPMSNLSLRVFYVTQRVDMSNVTFKFDVATITVRSMVFGDTERYNPNSDSWSFDPDPGINRFSHSALLLPNGDNLVLGGRRCNPASTTCANFTALSGLQATVPVPTSLVPWTADGSLRAARGNHTATLLPSGRVLAAGGANGPLTLKTAELYDPSARNWRLTGQLVRARSNHTASLLPNGTVLIAGGFVADVSTGSTSNTEVYYPASESFSPAAVMVSSRQAHTATLLPDGGVLVTGGYGIDGSGNLTYLSTAEVYFSTSNRWVQVGAMSTARADHTATLLHDGRVLLAGGSNAGGITRTAEMYDPVTGTFSDAAATDMPNTPATGPGTAGRFAHTATLLPDGRVLVAGGSDSDGEISAAIVYTPGAAGGSWAYTSATGNEMNIRRLRHTAVLLPNGKVMVAGGVKADGSAIDETESFDLALSSWSMQGRMPIRRGYHASVLLSNNRILNVGGSDRPNSYIDSCDSLFMLPRALDAQTPGGTLRVPSLTAADTTLFDRGGNITLRGSNLKGVTEGSGGGQGPQQSSFHNPRLYLRSLDGRGSGGFLVDLSTRLYAGLNTWSNVDSSITITMPPTSGLLPYGWFHLHDAVNAQFSDGLRVHAGPPLPTGVPGVATGTLVGSGRVLWSWTPAAGCSPPTAGVCEGYNLYSGTNSVFISTHNAGSCAGGTCQFVQSGLGPGAIAGLRVAAYNLSGDGTQSVSTVPVVFPQGAISSVSGVALTTGSIRWDWSSVSGALSYNVFRASTGAQLANVLANQFIEVALATNVAHGLRVQAILINGDGPLSNATTVFTLAMTPPPGTPPIFNLSTGGFSMEWQAGGNPSTTLYENTVLLEDGTEVFTSSTTSLRSALQTATPNTFYTALVRAINGDNIDSEQTVLGSTYTLANPVGSLTVTNRTPSSISLSWDANANPSDTAYQVTASSDGFVTHFSTPIPFSPKFTGTSTTIEGLLTGRAYTVRVTARNEHGVEASPVAVSTNTDNGGAPLNTVRFDAPTDEIVNFTGSVGIPGRLLSVRVLPNTFSQDVSVLVSSQAPIAACGAVDAGITITTDPPLQPRFPIEITLNVSLSPPEAGITNASAVSLVRYDPVSNTCVPLRTRVDVAGNTLRATINHLSSFMVQQINAQANLNNARVFPNPVYMRTQGYITFDRLPASARVRIYTLRGEEVFDERANGSGVLLWPATNKDHRPVASGLYFAVIENGDQREIMKLAVIR